LTQHTLKHIFSYLELTLFRYLERIKNYTSKEAKANWSCTKKKGQDT